MLHCGLLGEKLGHSYSPKIHGLLGDYEYRLYEKTPEELPGFLRSGQWDGLNVTIPYKKTVMPYLDEVSEVARQIGSVNTLVRRPDGSLYGDNTDVYGFACLLESSGVGAAGQKALILGSGGASVSVNHVLQGQGARTVIISRSGADNYENLDRHKDAVILVNTTPVGMYPDTGKSPVDLAGFPSLECVLDIIYNPCRTALLMQAEELGIPAYGGLLMLTAQAVRSSELFTGEKIDPEQIRRITQILTRDMQNIILIGMPGCGKSAIAQMLCARSGRQYTDLDEEFTKTYRITPEQCIRREGEARFRELESRVIADVCGRSSLVISTGGGCVTRPSNYPLLHQNGRILWIRREIKDLPVEGRPLSQDKGPEALYRERKPMYERFADHVIDNDGTLEEAVRKILDMDLL